MDKQEALIRYENEKKRQETIEHRDVLLAISKIIKTPEGEILFNYLFKNFDVMTVPAVGMQGMELHEYLGFLRAGNSIYKLVCEADSEKAGSILAKQERDRYADQYQYFRIENGLYENANNDNT